MASAQTNKAKAEGIALGELSFELSRLDLTRPDNLGSQAVDVIAQCFQTDRVSLAFLSYDNCAIVQAFYTGFDVPVSDWPHQNSLISQVCNTRDKVLVTNVSEGSHPASSRAASYKTSAFALFPVIFQRQTMAVLCVSNLSGQQVEWLQKDNTACELFISQLAQLCRLIATGWMNTPRSGSDTDEMGLLAKLMDQVDRGINSKDVFSIFAEVVSELLPIDALAVIHDCLKEPAQSVVCLQRPVHQSEVVLLLGNLSQQWGRRHRNSVPIDFESARVIGRDLMMVEGECPAELRLASSDVFPIFLDNDLFALVALSPGGESLAGRRTLKVFSTLLQQLLLHVKKELLLAQNSEMQTVDSLTGLYNERHFYELTEREFDRARRYNLPLSILFIDIDHFKDVNDTYGFETGDLVLQEMSRIIIENMRTTDFVSRYSGERFVVVLPESHYKNAEMMANRLRRYIENYSFYIANSSVFIKVTASVGVASYLDHKPTSVAQFIEFADTALYFAKRNGRNQVVGYSYVINLMIGDTSHKG